MIPIAMLPAAGILLAFGTSFQDPNIVASFPFLGVEGMVRVLRLMSEAGSIIFSNLPILFAVGVAVGLSNDEGIAGLSAIVGFLIMNVVIGQFLGITAAQVATQKDYAMVLGIPSLQTGVFGGIVIGILSAYLYKKYYRISLPSYLEYFSGKRSVPIITSFAALFVGIIMAIVWPPVQHGINNMSNLIMHQGLGLSAFLFGFVERLLIPFGLNHVWWPTFWLQFGEYINKSGNVVHGDQLIFFAQLKDQVPITAGTFMAGETPVKLFCVPAIALAIYRCADEKNKGRIKGIMLSGAITSIVCGITEPIEFSFLFVAPVLYGIHAFLTGLVFLLMYFFQVHIGLSFSGGLIDYLFFGILPDGPHWYMALPIGLVMGTLYYFIFTFAIRRWNLLTPGRGEEEIYSENPAPGGVQNTFAMDVIRALGGLQNMTSIEACMSRLRIDVIDKSRVDKSKLKALGASGVVEVGNNIQSVFGMKSDRIKEEIRLLKDNPRANRNNIADIAQPTLDLSLPKDDKQLAKLITSISAPCTGRLLSLKDIPDEVFSSGMMGTGFAIEIAQPQVVSPVDGQIISIFPTGHALTILSRDGLEILLHLGLDTVKLAGKGFDVLVKAGDPVAVGDPLVQVNIATIREQGLSLVSPMIFTNIDNDHYAIMLGNARQVEIGQRDIVALNPVAL